MKKKFKDLTVEELYNICYKRAKNYSCEGCPFLVNFLDQNGKKIKDCLFDTEHQPFTFIRYFDEEIESEE